MNENELVGEQEQYKSEIERQCIEMQAQQDRAKQVLAQMRGVEL